MFHSMRKMQPGLITQAVTTVICSVMLGLLVFKWNIGYMAGFYFVLAEATIKCLSYSIFVYFDPDVWKCFADGITVSQAFTEWWVYLYLAIPGLLMQGWWAWEICSILAATVSNSTVGAWVIDCRGHSPHLLLCYRQCRLSSSSRCGSSPRVLRLRLLPCWGMRLGPNLLRMRIA